MFQIREATPDDAPAIMRLIAQRFGDDVRVGRVRAILPEHITQVADTAAGVVGFVDGFMTQTRTGQPRFELDLIAVSEAAAGQGIGQALIRAVTAEAVSGGAGCSRVLVAVDNVPMERALIQCGYAIQRESCGLFISDSQDESPQRSEAAPDKAHLIPVQTLTYSGIWLEGQLSSQAIQAARTRQANSHLDIIGTVQPLSDVMHCEMLTKAGFTQAGTYHQWQLVF